MPKILQNDKLHLEGYYDHKISATIDTGQWQIIKVDTGTIGTLATEYPYPFGKHVWNLNMSKVSRNFELKARETLKLSLVSNKNMPITFIVIYAFIILLNLLLSILTNNLLSLILVRPRVSVYLR